MAGDASTNKPMAGMGLEASSNTPRSNGANAAESAGAADATSKAATAGTSDAHGATSSAAATARAAKKGWRSQLFMALRWLVGIATVAMLVKVGSGQASELRQVDLHLRPLWLIPAAVFTVAAGLVLPMAWRGLLLAYGWEVNARRAIRAWFLSQATRYLPTGAMAVASRLSLSAAEGVPRSVAGASFVLEAVLLLGWTTLFGAIFIPSSVVPGLIRLILGIGAAIGLVGLPWLMGFATKRIPGFRALADYPLQEGVLLEATALFCLNTVLRSAQMLALAAALMPMRWQDIPLLLGASFTGVIAGMIGITPAGIGIREGVIATVLADRFGIGDAAALAVLLRAWDFAFELVFLGGASWFGRKKTNTDTN